MAQRGPSKYDHLLEHHQRRPVTGTVNLSNLPNGVTNVTAGVFGGFAAQGDADRALDMQHK